MESELGWFEKIVRRAFLFTSATPQAELILHPFETRNIHHALPPKVKTLFDDGHYAEATFQAFKFVDKTIQRLSKLTTSGFSLMMAALPETSPLVQLTPCKTTSEKDEQKGYQFLFAGGCLAIRNPRGHEYNIEDSPDTCLDHLSLASLLLRRLEQSGFSIS
jgi:uncharacterized protein (TIGR02391 family)